MTDDVLDPALATELLARQATLHASTADVLSDLDLLARLAAVGDVCVVGSAAMGLMVQPDIDISIECDTLSTDTVFLLLRPLASHPRVRQLSFVNETGRFNPGFATDGLYWGVQYRPARDAEWKLDLWFWKRGATPGNREFAAALQRRLTPDTRLAILWIKQVYQQQQRYGPHGVRSVDVYDAVLEHGVRSPAAFAAYLAARTAIS